MGCNDPHLARSELRRRLSNAGRWNVYSTASLARSLSMEGNVLQDWITIEAASSPKLSCTDIRDLARDLALHGRDVLALRFGADLLGRWADAHVAH